MGIICNDSEPQAWKDNGVKIVTANYNDHLAAAFVGVEGVFCMIPPNVIPDLDFRTASPGFLQSRRPFSPPSLPGLSSFLPSEPKRPQV